MSKGIGIAGITGRMRWLLTEEVAAAGAKLVGGTNRHGAAPEGMTLFPNIAALAAACDVVVDFSHASAIVAHAQALATTGTGWVLGTTGLSAVDEAAVAEASRSAPVIHASGFSIGVNLMLALAQRLAEVLPGEQYDAEIVEMHHGHKVDAPSGTAIEIGRSVATGRGVDLEDIRESGRDGHTGAQKTGAIGFAALRGGEMVGEHTLLFTSAAEQIALTHRAFDRRAFAIGAIRAALWLNGRQSGLYSMMDVLGVA